MHVAKEDIPIRMALPGAIARQLPDFGPAEMPEAWQLGAEYFSLAAGTDIAPLLRGLADDACQAPHWGYLVVGEVVVTYTDGTEETCRTGESFFWPAGHSVRVVQDADVIMFSPQVAHGAALEHILDMATAQG